MIEARRACLALGLAVLAGLTGCFERQRLQGKWETADHSLAIEFLKNGDVLWTQPLGTVTGHWETVENNRIKVTFTGFAGLMGPQYCGYAFEDRALLLSGECVLAEHYVRVKK